MLADNSVFIGSDHLPCDRLPIDTDGGQVEGPVPRPEQLRRSIGSSKRHEVLAIRNPMMIMSEGTRGQHEGASCLSPTVEESLLSPLADS